MKTMIQTLALAVIAATAAGSLAVAAPAPNEAGFENTPGSKLNGTRFNGIKLNTVKFNTVRFNGFSLNGAKFNGAALTGAKAQGPIVACDADTTDICKPGVVAVTLATGQRLILD